jgi:predicted O-methyltransferase YrrM
MQVLSLHNFGVAEGITCGRSLRDGYTRGCSVWRRDLLQKLIVDPHYQNCLTAMKGRTLIDPPRLMNLYLLIRLYLPLIPNGDIIEFGSYRGGSALFMAKAMQIFMPKSQLFALDTFEGMPQTDKSDLHRAGQFNDTSYDDIQKLRDEQDLTNLTLVKGLFQETAGTILTNGRKIAMAHIDCDIKSAVVYSYETVKPFMVKGGYYIFDDSVFPSCLSATEAVEQLVIQRDGKLSEQIFPHHVFREGL